MLMASKQKAVQLMIDNQVNANMNRGIREVTVEDNDGEEEERSELTVTSS